MRRGVRRLLALLILVTACTSRERRAGTQSEDPPVDHGPGKLAEIDLTGGAPESTDAGGLLSLPASRTFPGLLRTLARASEDEDTTGFLLRLGGRRLGWARTEELGRVLRELRRGGKPVVCHAHDLGNSSAWLLAQGCDEVWLSPAGGADTVGIAAQLVFLRGAMEKVSVQADFLHMGRYKSAVETFTRDGPSEDAEQAMRDLLQSIRKSWLAGAKQARSRPGYPEHLEKGPYSAEAAKKAGVVDRVGYEDEAREAAQKRANATEVRTVFGRGARAPSNTVSDLIRVLSGAGDRTSEPHIAVVPAVGGIAMSGGGPFGGGGLTANAMNKTLRRLAQDDNVRAVVLRIDSPGGSALASDLMWHEIMLLREKKPVIASVGEMAASGGYYLACAAHKVVAEKTSIVGSIGVFGGKIVVGPALAELGVNSVTLAAKPGEGAESRAAYLSALTPWDDPTRDKVRAQMRSIYDLFIDRVVKGRGMKKSEVEKIAQGRVWTGAQGKANGLVDELGGLNQALALARKRAELDADAPVTVEGGAESLLELLMLDEDADAARVKLALARLQSQSQRLLDLIPPEVRSSVQSLLPLTQGERAVTALPYAVIVR